MDQVGSNLSQHVCCKVCQQRLHGKRSGCPNQEVGKDCRRIWPHALHNFDDRGSDCPVQFTQPNCSNRQPNRWNPKSIAILRRFGPEDKLDSTSVHHKSGHSD